MKILTRLMMLGTILLSFILAGCIHPPHGNNNGHQSEKHGNHHKSGASHGKGHSGRHD